MGTDKGGIGQTDNNGQLLSTLLGGGEAIGAAYYAYTSYLNKWNSMNEEAKKKSNPIGYRFYHTRRSRLPRMLRLRMIGRVDLVVRLSLLKQEVRPKTVLK